MRPGSYAAVVGSANVDIGGRAFAPLIERDSNPGAVGISYGGVGKNIAHNLRLLGADVYMLTALGTDALSGELRRSCERSGIDMSRAREVPGGAAPIYLFISDEDGDMRLAVCDAEIAGSIDESYLARNLELLNGAAAVAADCNLSREALAFLAGHCTAPLFVDPVSVSKARRLSGLLGGIHTLKPNILEAEELTGVEIRDRASLELAGQRILDAGVQRVFISLGAKGLYCAGRDIEPFIQPCLGCELVNATGGGDAVMAMLVRAHMLGLGPRETASRAMASGALAVESAETVNPELSMAAIESKLEKEQ